MKGPTRKEVTARIESVLRERGYLHRNGIWAWPIQEGVWGWLGLNTGRGPDAGSLRVNPVIGVRHDAIERLVERFQQPTEVCFSPTIASNIGYYREPGEFLEFTFRGDAFDSVIAAELVDMVDSEGKTAVAPLADLARLRAAMGSKQIGIPAVNQLRYPIIFVMMGDGVVADQMATDVIKACDGRDDPGHAHLRRYFEAFSRWRQQQSPLP